MCISFEPLRIDFHEPLDHLTLAYRIRVKASSGDRVPGAIAPGGSDASWQFTPSQTWRAGTYEVVVDPRLEDLAGNRTTGLFDDPSRTNRIRQETATPSVIEFTIGDS
ncbi:MAG: Ig-like domain-containing protein [Pseudomonadota bacterium]